MYPSHLEMRYIRDLPPSVHMNEDEKVRTEETGETGKWLRVMT